MKAKLGRLTGFLLIFAAALGLILAVAGLLGVWRYKASAEAFLITQMELAVSVMDTTAQGLGVADTALQTTQTTVQTLNQTVQTLAQSITDTAPLMDSLSVVLGKDFPKTIETTQTSLKSAQASAKIIDDVLRVVTAIPFFPGKPYDPEVPLNVALGDVSRSLDGMPASFRQMESDLTKANANLTLMQSDIEQIADNVLQVQTNLEQARKVIAQYEQATLQLRDRLQWLQEKTPAAVNIASAVFSLFLLWFVVAQLGLLTQGLDLLRKDEQRG
jgi:methyl-accepting chemotaxis protein